jgi:hypothetical protein
VDDEERRAKWRSWVDQIRGQLIQAHHNRELWEDTTEAIRRVAPESPGTWIRHYSEMYAAGQLMAIRRVVRGGRDSISLVWLLKEIRAHPRVMSVDHYLGPVMERGASPEFVDDLRDEYERLWGDGHGHVDPAKTREAQESLIRTLRAPLEHADRRIAHIDRKAVETLLTFDDLSEALNEVGKVYQRWAALLTAVHQELIPVVQDNWRASFAQPLFPENA